MGVGESGRKGKEKVDKLTNGGGNGSKGEGGSRKVNNPQSRDGGGGGGDGSVAREVADDDSGSAMDDGVDVFFDADEGWVSVSSDADYVDHDNDWTNPHRRHPHDDDDDESQDQDSISVAARTNDDSIDGREGMGDSHHRLASVSIDVSRTASTTSNIRYLPPTRSPAPPTSNIEVLLTTYQCSYTSALVLQC